MLVLISSSLFQMFLILLVTALTWLSKHVISLTCINTYQLHQSMR